MRDIIHSVQINQLVRISVIALILCISSTSITGNDIKVERLQTYGQESVPELIDNYLFTTYFSNNKSAYNLRGYKVANATGYINNIKVNPAGHSFALLSGKAGKRKVSIHPINGQENERQEIKGLIDPSAICYSPDSRQIIIADNKYINFYGSSNLSFENKFQISSLPTEICISPNGFYIAAVNTDGIDILNASSGEIRKHIDCDQPVSVAFSNSSNLFGVLKESGTADIYDTANYSIVQSINGLGVSTSLFFHPDENYIGMVSDENRIQFVNLFDNSDRPVIYESQTKNAKFVKDGQNNLYVVSTTPTSVKYRQTGGFVPNYSLQLGLMVEERMREWTKMRPGESELEYRERVNEESIKAQRQKFIIDVTGELALTSGLTSFSDIRLGRYNPQDGTLIISLNGLNDIYLTVPQEDMAGFGDGNNLQFSNQVFSISPSNNFELIYVEVYNPTNGKEYVFDNLEQQNLDFLSVDDGFVSLDLIMQSAREDVILKSIRDNIMQEARDAKLLSDHTSINVETHIEPSIDANGNHIKNYHVDFTYQVDAEGSATEDFPPGKYRIIDSKAAISLLNIVKSAFSHEFANYIVPGKSLQIEITGSADALPINGAISYDNSFGEITNEPCFVNGNMTAVTISPSTGIKTNEQLAYMRAKSVEKEMESMDNGIAEMKISYRHSIEVSKEKGAQFRRINVSLIFIDAL